MILFGQGDSVHLCGIIANCREELLSRGNSTPYKVQRDECEESVGGLAGDETIDEHRIGCYDVK